MATPQPINSPFGNSPTSLPPGPGGDAAGAAAAAMATEVPQVETPAAGLTQGAPVPEGASLAQPAAQPAAAPQQSLDDVFAEFDAPAADGAEDVEPLNTQPEPTGLESLKEQVRESATRFKNAFTVTTPESIGVLKKSGLFDDVRSIGGTIQVRRKGREGWENFDRDKIELVGDTLDLARDAVEVIAENTFRAGGAALGTAALPGAGTLGGAAAGGATGAIAAKNVGDFIAQTVMGIERDPERNMLKENAVAGAFGAGFNLMGSTLARRLAARTANASEAKKTIEYATKAARGAMEDIAEVKNSGIMLGEFGNFKLDPQQLVGHGNVPELDVTAKELSKDQSFRNFRKGVSDSLTNAYDSVAKSLGAASGKGANIADDFVLTANDVKAAEGKLIGSFRALADEKLAGQPQPAPRFLQTIQMMKESIPTPGHAERQLGLTPPQAKNFMRELNVMTQLMGRTGGQIRIDTAQAIQDRLTKQINSHINSANGRQYGIALIDLKNAIRDDGIDMLENVLPESYKQMYSVSKGRYKDIIGSTDQLGKMLETENISRNELVSKLFEGKGSYKFAQSAKTLINETNPKLWDQLSGEYVSKLKNDATDPISGAVNWGQISKKWSNLDPRLQKDVLQSTGIPPGGMDALIRLGIRVQGTTFEALPKDPDLKFVKKALKQVFIWKGGGAAAQGSAAGQLLDGMGRDKALSKWMADGGLEEILKEMPGLKPVKKQMLRDWVARDLTGGRLMTTKARRSAENE